MYSAHTGNGIVAAMKVGDRLVEAAAGEAIHAAEGQEAEMMTVDTPTSFGSITKTFDSASLMKLVEEGKLSLDDTVCQYLPQEACELFATAQNDTLTVRHLMSMRSGLDEYFTAWMPAFSTLDMDAAFTPQDLVELSSVTRLPDLETEYSNTNYILLGMIISNLTGVTTSQGLADLSAIVPNGIEDIVFAETNEQWTGAHGYLPKDPENENYMPDVYDTYREFPISIAQTAGNVFLPARSMAEWMYALNTGQVVSEDSLRQMSEFQGDIYFEDAQLATLGYDMLVPYGLGLMDMRGVYLLELMQELAQPYLDTLGDSISAQLQSQLIPLAWAINYKSGMMDEWVANVTRPDATAEEMAQYEVMKPNLPRLAAQTDILAAGMPGHGGNFPGYEAWAAYVPGLDMGYGIAMNHQDSDNAYSEVLGAILDMAADADCK